VMDQERFVVLETINKRKSAHRRYKALENETGKLVHLKRVNLKGDGTGISYTVLREISFHKSLRHPRVVELYDVVTSGTDISLSFEYVDRTLYDEISSHQSSGGVPVLSIKKYIHQILQGVSFCHAHGVMHRDLKPQNVLIDSHGCIKLSSFSLSRTFVNNRTYTHEVVTLWYRCPEILLGCLHYSTSIDIWSIGCIIAELASDGPLAAGKCEIEQLLLIFQLLGTPTEEVWPGVSQLRDYNPIFPRWLPKDLSAVLPRLDEEGAALLARTLAYDPARRISAAEAMDMPYLHEADDR
jgi:serine/threonine protein kinase